MSEKMLIDATLESSAAPSDAVATMPLHAQPQQATAKESKTGRLRNGGRTGGGYVERLLHRWRCNQHPWFA